LIFTHEKRKSTRAWQSHLVTPLETFAGQDLLKVLADNQEKGSAQRKVLQAKITAARAAQQAVKPADKMEEPNELATGTASKDDEASEAEQKDDEKDTTGNDSESAEDAEDEVPESKEDKDESEMGEKEPHVGISCDGCKVRIF
jgi:hypothetical protein